MAISAKDVAALRQQTGAGMMDCKKALVECDGDMEKALEWLQKKSLASVGKRADKVAAEGAVGSYVHGGRIGVLVEINSETDFVARNDDFQQLLKDVCMHVAAANPTYVRDDEIGEAEVEKNREIFAEQMKNEGKPDHILARIVDGKIAKWKKDICLVDQPFVKNPDVTVGQYVDEVAGRIREKITIRRFVRFEVGEGIEKKVDDFAAEVAAAAQG
ncbi:MAG: translation elongation factor Ts [Myxococcales bacterium]|nr:translation elongation factor Ts [Myxococcales bacterium]